MTRRRPRRVRAGVLVAMLAVALAAAPTRDASAQAARDSTAHDAVRRAPRDTTNRSVVPRDSLPTDDARAVLRTIPEPLPPGEQVTPADTAALAPIAPSFTPPDTAAADTSGVPTPTITAPLGEGPAGPRRAVLDTTVSEPGSPPPSAPSSSSPSSSPPPSSPPPPASAAEPSSTAAADTCWRVQVAAYEERPVAESHRSAAASQLLVPMTIENERGRLKIRTSDCLTHAAGDALRRRALDAGFPGAFLLRMGANGEAIPVGSPAPAAAPKQPAASKQTAVKHRAGTPTGAVRAATTPVRKKPVRK
jgi:hypothetical protein